MRKTLVVVPNGGLCNRLRVVLSGYLAAQQYGWSIRVEWGRDRNCWAHFDDLFEPLTAEHFSITHRSFWNNYISRKNLRLPGLLRVFMYDRQQSQYCPQQHGDLPTFVQPYRKVYLSTGYALMDYPENMNRLLRPLPRLQERIDRIRQQFPAEIVGVHIRRTDLVVAMKNSTVEAFYAALDAEIAQHPAVCFYLATDDEQLKAEMQMKYGRRILMQSTQCCRNTLAGIEEAVVDLWLLASTRKILGSYYSSYSVTAAEIGEIPLCVVKSAD